MTAPPLLDSHLHLQDPRLEGIRAEVFRRAVEAGIGRMLCNATRERDWPEVLQLSATFPSVIPFIGIHPWYADPLETAWDRRLEAVIAINCCGIGEAGLDGKCPIPIASQERVLAIQLGLAAEHQRPVALHCVGAWGRLIDMLERLVKTAGLPPLMIHSFGGSLETMHRLVNLGCWISFSARLIDRDRQTLQQVFCETPLERILLETDSPDQLPQALRHSGNVPCNEPANIADFYRQAAKLRRMNLDDFTQQIWNNGEIYADSLLSR